MNSQNNYNEIQHEKIEYVNVRIPKALKEKIDELAQKKNVAMWKIILEAVSLYENLEKKPKKKKELPRLDKCAWYIYKFSKSVSLFLENPDDENWWQLDQRIAELRTRIFGRDTEWLQMLDQLAVQYKKNPSTRLKIEINDVAKMIISEIILKMLFEE